MRFDSSVVEDLVHDYVLFEVQRTEQQYEQMREGLSRWAIYYVVLTLCAVAFAVIATWRISESIYRPIKKLHDVTNTITRNDLEALMTRDNVDEITELGMSFNIMVGKIRELLDAKLQEQDNLKKAELRALQAQINPHFLYNTLDTIIWMAESKKTAEVVELVSALSNFFRISLSKGKDWITIGEEVERTRSYLMIQKMRYRDIMDFSIDVGRERREQHGAEAHLAATGRKRAVSRRQAQAPGRHHRAFGRSSARRHEGAARSPGRWHRHAARESGRDQRRAER